MVYAKFHLSIVMKRIIAMLAIRFSCATHIAILCTHMMTSSNGNVFRVTGPLCGEFTGHRWIPLTKARRGALIYSFICAWINGWVNNREAGDLRHHRDYYDVIVMVQTGMLTHWTTIPVTTTPISVQPRFWNDGMPQKSHPVSSHALGRQHSDLVSYCHGLALGMTFGNVSSRLKRVFPAG